MSHSLVFCGIFCNIKAFEHLFYILVLKLLKSEKFSLREHIQVSRARILVYKSLY